LSETTSAAALCAIIAMSLAENTDSSAIKGTVARLRSRAMPAIFHAGSGCSTRATPSSAKTGRQRTAVGSSQA
jgi:hypothetical protein